MAVKAPLVPMLAVVEALPALIVTLPGGTSVFALSVPVSVTEAMPYATDCEAVRPLNAGAAAVIWPAPLAVVGSA